MWCVISCCGKCNDIDVVCQKSLYQIHPSDKNDIELIYEYSNRNDSDLWVTYTLEELEDPIGGCGHTGYPTYTTYARIQIENETPNFMTLKELDNLMDF